MKYLLDTNTCIRIINGRSQSARNRLLSIPASDIVIPSIVRAELFYGSAKSQTPEASRRKQDEFLKPFMTVPFDDASAETYATIRSNLEKSGTPIGAMDMLIAAICLARQLILVTHNTREFSRIENLQLEDWQEE